MMKYKHMVMVGLSMLLAISLSTEGQSIFNPLQQDRSPQKDTVTASQEPISLSNINSASTQAFGLFTRLAAERLAPKERKEIASSVNNLIDQTSNFFADTSKLVIENLNFRELDVLENNVGMLDNEISRVQDKIFGSLQRVQKGSSELKSNHKLWSLTMSSCQPGETPMAIMARIQSVIERNDSISELLEKDINYLLVQSDKVTGLQIRLNRFQSELMAYNKLNSSKVFRRDMPPIWQIFTYKAGIQTNLQWEKLKKHLRDDGKFIFETSSRRLILIVVVLIVLIILVLWLKASAQKPEIGDEKGMLSLFVYEIFRKPFEVTLLIGLYLTWLLIPNIPSSFTSIIAIVSVYAIIRFAFEILPKEYRPYILGFSISYLLLRFYGLFYDYQILGRLLLLAAQITAIYYTASIIQKRTFFFRKNSLLQSLAGYLGYIFLFFLLVAFFGNIFGRISFSEYLSGGTVKSTFHILTTYIGFHILVAVIFIGLTSPIFKNSNIIRSQINYIFEKIYKLFKALFLLAWVFVALDQFKLKKGFTDWASSVLLRENPIGEANITLMSVFLFVFVIWLSIFVSRVVRHILQEEVFPRVKIERGMPGTIIMLVRISLISIGFFLAAAAAGMDLSSLAIILGAFSVGIGFGLQNIFNNLVSGLILAFERPIKEGDVVELNSLLGTVIKIGIRSSIVRLNTGAEVIIPNGELISNELVNWTLSDKYRRADIRVGVAYGTNPQVVIDILERVTKENKRVNTDPEPRAYFISFGDSSLDFRLLAWIDQDYRYEVESEIRVEINKQLKEAGIEIPFPQTDLHVKSVTEEAGKRLNPNAS